MFIYIYIYLIYIRIYITDSNLDITDMERTLLLISNFAGTNLKIILSNYQNNFVGILKVMSNIDIPATGLSVLHIYFDSPTKLFF